MKAGIWVATMMLVGSNFTCGRGIAPPQDAATSTESVREGDEFQLVHGQSDVSGMGYYADPAEYLTDAQLDELPSNTTGLPVMLPTWLPGWTRDVEPVARVVGPTYFVDWSSTAEEHPEWQGDLADEHLIALGISNSTLGPAPPSAGSDGQGFRLESETRSYWYDPDNIGIDEPVSGAGCTTSEAQMFWRDLDRVVRFKVDAVPNPDCSLFTHEHLMHVADSMVQLSEVGSANNVLPEHMHHLFERSPSGSPSTPHPAGP